MNVWDAMMNAARPRGAGQTHATVAGALGWLATMPHGVATVVVGVAALARRAHGLRATVFEAATEADALARLCAEGVA